MKVGNGGQTVPGGDLTDRQDEVVEADERQQGDEPTGPSMPVIPFPTFENVPTLPQQSPGNGYESGRDSRAR